MERFDRKDVFGRPGLESRTQRFTYWLAILEVITAIGLADAAVIAWSAGLISAGQLIAWFITYLLISAGILVTSYAVGESQATQLARVEVKRTEVRRPGYSDRNLYS